MILRVRGRPPGAGEGPPACPFVAFAEEPDSRAGLPDHRHRCYAQEPPEPRARAHQERFCLTAAFASCAYFQDWAVRQAAARVSEPVAVGAREPERRGRAERSGRFAAGAGQIGAFDSVDPRFASTEADAWDAIERREEQRVAESQRAVETQRALEAQRAERTHERSRSGNGGPSANGDERYSGYPTAARLLGIGSPAYAPGADELAEPGKWQRSERLQSWLEDAQQGVRPRPARAATVEEEAWSETFAPVDTEADAYAHVEPAADFQAGVLPYRPSQARRAPMPAPQRIGRQAARRGMPWERRAAPEVFPELRRQHEERRRFPPVLLAALGLLLAAAVVFALPGLLASPPRQAAASPTPAPTETLAPTPSATIAVAPATPQVYTVAKGDTLGAIARSFNLTVAELLAANPSITDPGRIRVGQKLTIPTPAPAPTPGA